jgi:hypothetical protein
LSTPAALAAYHCDASCEQDLKRSQAQVEELLASQDKIIGVEVIIAQGSSIALESHWGHALMRFVSSTGSWAQDFVLEFVGETGNAKVSVSKGLLGGYAAAPELDSMQSDWSDYIASESRDLTRVIIPTSPEMRERLLQTLLQWLANPSKHLKNYTFLNNNCGGLMTRYLQDAGLPHDGIRARIPAHIPRYLKKLLLNPYPELVIPSPVSLFSKAAEILGISMKDLKDGNDWPADSADRLGTALTDLEIKKMLRFLSPKMPKAVFLSLEKDHNYFNGGAGPDETAGIKKVPAELYQLCGDEACVTKITEAERSLWSDDELTQAKKDRLKIADNELSGTPQSIPKSVAALPELVAHFELLLKYDAN